MQKNLLAKKRLREVMRICTLQIVITLTIAGTALAHPNYAQVLDREVTISLNNITLEGTLHELETKADVKFVYSPERLKLDEIISVTAERKRLGELLRELLSPRGIEFTQDGTTNFVTLKPAKKKANDKPSKQSSTIDYQPDDLTETATTLRYASITGVVTDGTTNQPLPGVNVIVKGTTNGTNTDADGRYAINASNGDALVFSFIGFASQEISITDQTVIDIEMREDAAKLNEVVVSSGYWETNRRESPANIVKVTAKDIEKQPVSNPLATLQALVPGMEVTQENGVPGGGFVVRVRGQNSIGNGNDPLYVIDGVPFTSTPLTSSSTSGGLLSQDDSGRGGVSPLNYINPSDIESIEILKDASATAIYGSRGSNGVVLITTKKGHADKTRIDLNFYTGVSNVAHFVDLLNTQQYMMMRHEAKRNDDAAVLPADYDLNGSWDTTRYTNWQKELLGGTARTTDAQLSFSGGSRLTQFSIGGGFHKETSVFPGDNSDQRISGHFSLTNISPNERLRINTSINYSSGKTNFLAKDLTGEAMDLTPVAPALFDENGSLNWQDNTWDNPLRYLVRQYEANTTNLIANTVVTYEILKGLKAKANIGITNTKLDAVTIEPKQFNNPSTPGVIEHRAIFSNTNFKNWIVEPQLTYNKEIGKGRLELLAGLSFFEQVRSGATLTGIGFSSEALMKNLGAASTIQGGNTYSQYRYSSGLGRINYIHDGKYVIDVTGRRDGSSRFGPGKQFANFGAIGVAWIFSNENFIKNSLGFLSYGKLRGSYGITGNDQLGDYEYLDTYTSTSDGYMGDIGLTPVRLGNDNFAWETNKKFETGLELAVLKDRLFAEVSYYRNRSSNQLIGYSLPPTAGFTSIRANLPATVQNTGVEIQLTSNNFERADFVWKTSLNITFPRSKLVEFPNLAGSPSYANSLVVGKPLNILKLYHYQGVDPATGLYQYEDINDDGAFNHADRYVVKFVGRDYYGGFQNVLQYKGLELSVLFQFVRQMGRDFVGYASPGLLWQQPTHVLERWQQEGNHANVQRFGTDSQTAQPNSLFEYSDAIIIDRSFIRLKNLSLSYSINSTMLKKLRIQNTRLFVQGQNLLTFSGFSGLDPESIDRVLPPLRTITIGINAAF